MSQYIGNFAKLCDGEIESPEDHRSALVARPRTFYIHRQRRHHHSSRRRHYFKFRGSLSKSHSRRLLFPRLARDQRKHLMLVITLVLMTSLFSTVSLIMWMTSGRH